MAIAQLNQAQRNHAEKRIKELSETAIKKLKKDNLIPAVMLTPSQKESLITRGLVKLKKPYDFSRIYCGLADHFDFSKHEKASSYKAGTEAKIKAIEADTVSAIDAIIMGGANEALESIKSFEAKMNKV